MPQLSRADLGWHGRADLSGQSPARPPTDDFLAPGLAIARKHGGPQALKAHGDHGHGIGIQHPADARLELADLAIVADANATLDELEQLLGGAQ